MTMAHIALSIESLVSKGRPAIWLTLSLVELKAAGFETISEFVDFLDSNVTNVEDIFYTNDPKTALGAISFLIMDSKVIELLAKYFNLSIGANHG